MIFTQWYLPLESRYTNWIETINEVFILGLSYMAICFTDFVLDPEVRSDIGPYYIGTICVMILVHMIVISISTRNDLRLAFKKFWNRYVIKNKNVPKHPSKKYEDNSQ